MALLRVAATVLTLAYLRSCTTQHTNDYVLPAAMLGSMSASVVMRLLCIGRMTMLTPTN